MPHDEIWRRIRSEATAAAESEPALASYLHTVVLAHDRLEDALSYLLASKLGSPTITSMSLRSLIDEALAKDPTIGLAFREDLRACTSGMTRGTDDDQYSEERFLQINMADNPFAQKEED